MHVPPEMWMVILEEKFEVCNSWVKVPRLNELVVVVLAVFLDASPLPIMVLGINIMIVTQHDHGEEEWNLFRMHGTRIVSTCR